MSFNTCLIGFMYFMVMEIEGNLKMVNILALLAKNYLSQVINWLRNTKKKKKLLNEKNWNHIKLK